MDRAYNEIFPGAIQLGSKVSSDSSRSVFRFRSINFRWCYPEFYRRINLRHDEITRIIIRDGPILRDRVPNNTPSPRARLGFGLGFCCRRFQPAAPSEELFPQARGPEHEWSRVGDWSRISQFRRLAGAVYGAPQNEDTTPRLFLVIDSLRSTAAAAAAA